MRSVRADGSRKAGQGRRHRAAARRRRHRPDHPEAVPQAHRADRLRRVPVLRLGAGARLEPPEEPHPGHRSQLRLRLEPRARAVGAAGLRLRGHRRLELRRHLLLQLHEDRPAARRAGRGRRARADGRRRGGGRPRGPRGPLRRPRRAVRTRRGAPAPPAQRPRRHRPHAGEGLVCRIIRARARASRPRHAQPLAMPKIALLPGDGIGPEVAAAAVRLLDAVCDDLTYDEHLAGGAAIDAHGTALTDEALAACQASDAVFLGALGGPKGATNESGAVRPEQGLFRLRSELGLYANLRPVKPLPALYEASPLKRELIENVALLVVRELTGGLYYGDRGTADGRAYDTMVYTVAEIERIARTAFRAARSRVTSVDKANVLDTSRLWRDVVTRIHSEEFPHIELEHLLVDAAAMRLVAAPRHFEVIVTENMFGDILSDEASMLTGSLGMLPTASLGGDGPSLFEPVHGTAPDIAGQGIANPIGMILSAALMLRHGLGREDQAAAVESAVDRALAGGVRPRDLGGNATTAETTQAVLRELK